MVIPDIHKARFIYKVMNFVQPTFLSWYFDMTVTLMYFYTYAGKFNDEIEIVAE